jgi:hypothetical protein
VRNFFLMSLICALVFVAFMALPGTIVPMHAEPGMQGNLPTPVQKLPTHPPIACVAPNWESESCDSRQTALPRRNPLRAFATPRPKTVLYDEPGGDYLVHCSTPSYGQSCARKCLPGTSRSSSNASDRLAPFSIGSASNVFPA